MSDRTPSEWGPFIGVSHRTYKRVQNAAAIGLLACLVLGTASYQGGFGTKTQETLFSIAVLAGVAMIGIIFCAGLCMGLGKWLAEDQRRKRF